MVHCHIFIRSESKMVDFVWVFLSKHGKIPSPVLRISIARMNMAR